MTIIRTIDHPAVLEIPKIKGSRFLSAAKQVASEAEALGFLTTRREEDPGATHHCYAWRLGPAGDGFRAGDDGEPSGTAGRPILQEIDGRGLTDVVVVVTRYYGGTKLGTGGLIRAYGEAAGRVLDEAGVREEPVVEALHLAYSYDFSGSVLGVLNAFSIEPAESSYEERIQLRVAVPIGEVESFRSALRDATHGRITITPSGA